MSTPTSSVAIGVHDVSAVGAVGDEPPSSGMFGTIDSVLAPTQAFYYKLMMVLSAIGCVMPFVGMMHCENYNWLMIHYVTVVVFPCMGSLVNPFFLMHVVLICGGLSVLSLIAGSSSCPDTASAAVFLNAIDIGIDVGVLLCIAKIDPSLGKRIMACFGLCCCFGGGSLPNTVSSEDPNAPAPIESSPPPGEGTSAQVMDSSYVSAASTLPPQSRRRSSEAVVTV
jgi:hypothetical protein